MRRIAALIALVLTLSLCAGCAVLPAAMLLSGAASSPEVYEDPAAYNDYIGPAATEEFRSKWGMDESILPATVEDLSVQEFKMVYYNPWDAQYLCYLTVEYTPQALQKELQRLERCPHTEYTGYYSVTGFAGAEDPLAMYADSYQGFVYAIHTPGRENCVTYVELIFCNYFMDLDYLEYIPAEYLPQGFDATIDNPYQLVHTQN